MDFNAVLAQLNDLPSTFKRQAAWYLQLIDSIASPLSNYTTGVDGLMTMLTFSGAQYGWLDVWGLLADVRRNPNESDVLYSMRIQETLLAWVATVPAIQTWLNLFAAGGTVTENLPAVGYALSFPPTMTLAQIAAWLLTFNRIRPAGVPFGIAQTGIGLYLGTVNFLGEGNMPGSYLGGGTTGLPLGISATTNNSQPLLPGLYFTDPLLNP